MLFHSFEFIFLFLPFVLAVSHVLQRLALVSYIGPFLLLSSVFFYGYWNPPYLLLVGASMVINYNVGRMIMAEVARRDIARARLVTTLIIAANLCNIGYFKYTNFLVDNLNAATGLGFFIDKIVLPVGISFYTFQEIAYLVDCYRGKQKPCAFIDYALFVMFFPHLIAGPITNYREMTPQFAAIRRRGVDPDDLAVGLSLFVFGLFKKVALADGMAQYATPVFDASLVPGTQITALEAWGGAIAYTLQLYFDFSGYSDMALGLARMFGVALPLNFNSPYKATNIIDFWRRWHMALSNFLREYIYVALGGNRHGPARRYVNLMLTMLIGGLWHGANWTFVIWGGLHGLFLCINHGWNAFKEKLGIAPGSGGWLGAWTGRIITFLAVVVAWVFFRAETVDSAIRMLKAMAGAEGFLLPRFAGQLVGPFVSVLDSFGVKVATYDTPLLSGLQIALTAIFLGVAFFAPASHELIPGVNLPDKRADRPARPAWRWAPSRRWILLTGALAALAIPFMLENRSEFLYFQF
ncbi:MAG: MBOAT family protein [Alphaproteobacteria bacterium]|nr:MBOAT family protein [Alphaproteobacteria bacterium]